MLRWSPAKHRLLELERLSGSRPCVLRLALPMKTRLSMGRMRSFSMQLGSDEMNQPMILLLWAVSHGRHQLSVLLLACGNLDASDAS